MRAYIGAGWHVYHITDRVVELRKEDVGYRFFTGRDGYVRVRVEPQMSRDQAVERAIKMAQANDAALGVKIAGKMLPPSFAAEQRAKRDETGVVVQTRGRALPLAQFQAEQRRLVHAFATRSEEPERKRYRV